MEELSSLQNTVFEVKAWTLLIYIKKKYQSKMTNNVLLNTTEGLTLLFRMLWYSCDIMMPVTLSGLPDLQ